MRPLAFKRLTKRVKDGGLIAGIAAALILPGLVPASAAARQHPHHPPVMAHMERGHKIG